MGAAPLPKPDEPPAEPASDADGWALLEGLRRRLEDQAAQGRKTQAQVAQLAESIAALVADQRRRSLWLNVNSFAAYLVFTLLCAAGCYLLYRSRAHELGAAREQAIGERDAAVRRADEALARAVARESTDTKAWEVYQLLELGKRAEAEAKLAALRDQPLSRTERAVLAARVHDSQVMEAEAALKAAAAALKTGRPADAIKPLEAALTSEPPGARAATMHYYLGVAYAKTELDKAAAHLQAAIAGDVEQDDARFQLASVLDRSGAYGQARAEYDRFATAHPQSPLALFAMRRSATLFRLPAGASPGTPGAYLAPGAPAAYVAPGGVAPTAPTPVPPAAAALPQAPAAPPPVPGPAPAAGSVAPQEPSSGSAAPAPGTSAVVPHAGATVRPAGAAPAAAPRPPLRPLPKPAARPAPPARPPSPADLATEPPSGSGGAGGPGGK